MTSRELSLSITGRRFAAITAAALTLAGCSPFEGWALKPAGYAGEIQFWQEARTGCIYQQSTKRPDSTITPVLRPDGSHMGCASATPEPRS
jgi:hypothetical protein